MPSTPPAKNIAAAPGATLDLFGDPPPAAPSAESLAPGAVILRAFAAAHETALWSAVEAVVAAAPLRTMTTPGGQRMSVAMTNCGSAGWISDRRGYRYSVLDPSTGRAWPALPAAFTTLAADAAAAAGFAGFAPDACLVNCYRPGTRLSLHRDQDERDFGAPIVSVSIGLPAVFLFGGLARGDRPLRVPLGNGDVVVWGGPSRLRYHGVLPLADGEHRLTGRRRFNLTFRRAL